jgi:branched-subunit amino acid transport protein AzlD
MKLKLAPVLVPGLVAAAAAVSVRVSTWDSIKASLITALSVAAAAALVRLSRGLPFTAASHFEPNEIQQITRAVVQLARSLRAFLVITILSMGALIMVAPLIEYANHVRAAALVWWGGRLLSGIVGGLLAYVVVRLFQIVGSDLSLLNEQSKFMVRAVQREAGKERSSTTLTPDISTNFRTPETYGQRIQ